MYACTIEIDLKTSAIKIFLYNSMHAQYNTVIHMHTLIIR